MKKCKIEIEYCVQWNYLPRAAGFAELIEDNIGVDNIEGGKVLFIKSKGGALEVFVNGNKIFSKLSIGRFPLDNELLKLIDSEI